MGDDKHIECFIEDCNLNSEYLWGDKGVCAKHWHLRSPIGADVKWEPRVKGPCESDDQCNNLKCTNRADIRNDDTGKLLCMDCYNRDHPGGTWGVLFSTDSKKDMPACISLDCKESAVFRDVRTGFSFCVVHKRRHETEYPGREWSQIEDCDPDHAVIVKPCRDCGKPIPGKDEYDPNYCAGCNTHTGDETCMRCGKQVKETEAYAVQPGYICRSCAVPNPPKKSDQFRTVLRLEQTDNGWLLRVNRKVPADDAGKPIFFHERYNVKTLRMDGFDACLEAVLLKAGIPLDGEDGECTVNVEDIVERKAPVNRPFVNAICRICRESPAECCCEHNREAPAVTPFVKALVEHAKGMSAVHRSIAECGFTEGWHSNVTFEQYFATAGPRSYARKHPARFALSFREGEKGRASHV